MSHRLRSALYSDAVTWSCARFRWGEEPSLSGAASSATLALRPLSMDCDRFRSAVRATCVMATGCVSQSAGGDGPVGRPQNILTLLDCRCSSRFAAHRVILMATSPLEREGERRASS